VVPAHLLRWTSVRAAEAVFMADADIDLDRREIHLRKSKTARGRRTTPLLPQLEEPILEWRTYCAEYNLNHPGRRVIVTTAGTPMQALYVWRIVRDVAALASLITTSGRRITPHTLRRTPLLPT
jgi:integrase